MIIIICRGSHYRNLLNTFMQLVLGRFSLSSLIRGRGIFRSTHYTGFINWCRTNVGHAQCCNIWRYCRIGSHKPRTHEISHSPLLEIGHRQPYEPIRKCLFGLCKNKVEIAIVKINHLCHKKIGVKFCSIHTTRSVTGPVPFLCLFTTEKDPHKQFPWE